jgi:hypothetical protein
MYSCYGRYVADASRPLTLYTTGSGLMIGDERHGHVYELVGTWLNSASLHIRCHLHTFFTGTS